MKKKMVLMFSVLMIVAFSVSAFAGCGDKRFKGVVIWGGEDDKPMIEQLIEDFKAANPDVKEEIKYAHQGVNDAQSIVAKDPEAAADVIMLPHDQIGIMAKSGLLAEIQDGTSATFKSDIIAYNHESAVQQVTYDNKIYGFPLTMDTYFMYYNRDIFPDEIQAGRDIIKSVDKMLAANMGNIPGTSEKQVAFGFNIGDGFYFNMGFFAMGCTLYGEDGSDVTACNFNNANGVKALHYYIDNFAQSTGKFKSDSAKNLATAVLNSRVGACVSGGWEMQDTFKNNDKIGYTTLPTIKIDGEDKDLVSFSNCKLYAVNNASKYKGTAIRLANFVTNKAAQLKWAEVRNYYPSNAEVQADKIVTDNDFMMVIKAQLEKSIPVPTIPEITRYWEPAKALGEAAYNGSLTKDNVQSKLDEFVQTLKATL